jgi:hypothetical protein
VLLSAGADEISNKIFRQKPSPFVEQTLLLHLSLDRFNGAEHVVVTGYPFT